ncbi:RsmB/NOP family class I SAM-dependent RNA methyltransferase [Candidatus Gracilibacteria bacterium]|nr:RsmB/NOP family class I SAM-dependent RNA methyltransferase [Candidatus Gracilibacteria bacterium]
MKTSISQERRSVSCRLNALKSTETEIEEAFFKASLSYTKLEFPAGCYLFDENVQESDLWRLKIYKAGKIYMQGISSQIPVQYFSNEKGKIKSLKILDACAAPGGKTGQLREQYPDAEIWAFESSKIRYEKMTHNFEKLGYENINTIHDDVKNIAKHIEELNYFDMILIDAPCSGEGAVSLSNTKFLENWSLGQIKKYYSIQKGICDALIPYLRVGGELLYSTCTMAPEENEGVIHYLLCKYPELQLENIDLEQNKYIKTKKGLRQFEKLTFKKEISENCVRVIPSEYSEGFFISKITKVGTE